MERLSARTRPASVRSFTYDRASLPLGLAHLGVGAFHRCHQAEYLEDALEAGAERRLELGVNLRPPSIAAQLGAQDGLYARTLQEGDTRETRVIGAIGRVMDAGDAPTDAIAALATPAIDTITLTVTEKGYCHVPATGALDWAQPELEADLARGADRQSVPGFLCAVLRSRMEARAPVTLVSCDNIPANGRILRAAVLGFAEAEDQRLAKWIEENVRFPSTMVDRIVPATSEADLAFAREALGVEDAGTVVGEPFRQWVVENDFALTRPRWDVGGAEFVGDVEEHEHVKMRVLNAAQSTFSWLGALAGLETTGDDAHDPEIAGFARRMILGETAPVLPVLKGMEAEPYTALTFHRLENRAIRHRNHQIATDSSQKINQRLLEPLRDRRERGLASPLLETALGAWVAYLARSQGAFGAAWSLDDPIRPAVERHARDSGGAITAFADRVLGEEGVFGLDIAGDAALRARVGKRAQSLLETGVYGTLGGTSPR